MELTYCKVRDGNWEDIEIKSLDGQSGQGVFNTDQSVWAICVATCDVTGISVITDNWDQYYLVQSIDLDYASSLEALGALERGM
jgi:hypothetical protein